MSANAKGLDLRLTKASEIGSRRAKGSLHHLVDKSDNSDIQSNR